MGLLLNRSDDPQLPSMQVVPLPPWRIMCLRLSGNRGLSHALTCCFNTPWSDTTSMKWLHSEGKGQMLQMSPLRTKAARVQVRILKGPAHIYLQTQIPPVTSCQPAIPSIFCSIPRLLGSSWKVVMGDWRRPVTSCTLASGTPGGNEMGLADVAVTFNQSQGCHFACIDHWRVPR